MQCPRCDRKLAVEDRFCSRCGLSRSLDGEPVDPLIGLTVSDRYRIEERIGVGGMGTVYRAQHVRFGQDVAIKVLHERYNGDEKLARRFEKEALTYGQVSHPNLVGLHDFGTTPDGMFYMALDYCPGKPLSSLLRERKQFSWRLATDVVMQVAQGLGAAHDCGVVHRDLKPENIIMTEIRPNRYHVRLLDFGIAKREDEDGPRLTQAGMVFGTPEYMSPEQARGKTVDKRSDIYALGTLFYELIVGNPPFHGGDKLRVMQQQANEPPVPPSQYDVGDLCIDVESLILRCLEKDPKARIQNTQDFLETLECIGPSFTNHRIGTDTAPVGEMPHELEMDTSDLEPTVRGESYRDSEASELPNDTSEHSPMAEGFHHQRMTGSTRVHLPVFGAVLTIFVIVIGGGLLVRNGVQQEPGESSSHAVTTDIATPDKQASVAEATNLPNPKVVTQDAPKKEKTKVDAKTTKTKPTKTKVNTVVEIIDPTLIAAQKSFDNNQPRQARIQLQHVLRDRKVSALNQKELRFYQALNTRLERRENDLKKTLTKANDQLKSADFNRVERSISRAKKLGARPADYQQIQAKLDRARAALKRARRFYAKADCRRTLSSLQPILSVSPHSKRVAKLVNACRQALPPQRL